MERRSRLRSLRRPSELIEEVDEYVDGYVVNYGVAAACSESLSNSGICLRTDCYKPTYPGRWFVCVVLSGRCGCFGGAMMNMLYLHHRKSLTIIEVALPSLAKGVNMEFQ